jgi:hypothetical protein
MKADVMRMVEATVMVYRFMEEQHKLDSFLPKQPLILQDVKRLNEFALAICHRFSIPECDSKGRPANIFKMNTSIATLSVQCGDQTTLYMEGTQLEPQCFSCHVDNKNDPVYHYVWVVYKHVPYLASHLWFQVGNVFTFHKSCGDYMKWLTKGCFLKEQQLHLYFDYYCLQRLSLTLDDSHLIEYKEKPLEPITMLLFFDKVTGCMSSSIDATAQLITHNNWGANLQRIVEIVTPIGWVHGFVNYPKVMKKWRQHGLPPYELGHNGNLTVAYILECKEMFGRLNNGKYPHLTPFVNSNLFLEHCLLPNYCMYKTICHILREQAHGVEVSYHAASVKLMQVHLWRGISAQHVLYLLGGLAVIPPRFCADLEICVGTNAHKKVKHILLVASLNKCFHDLAKECKVPPW